MPQSPTTTANPYTPPTSDSKPVDQADDPQRVLAAARGQRHVNLMILVSFAMIGVAFIDLTAMAAVVGIFRLIYIIVMAVVVFRVINALYSLPRAIIYALFSIVPMINLLLLLSISSTATKLLKANGFKVGLLGAKMADVEKWAENAQDA